MKIERLRNEVVKCVGAYVDEQHGFNGIIRWNCDAELTTTNHVSWFPNLGELVGFDVFGAELWVVQGDCIA